MGFRELFNKKLVQSEKFNNKKYEKIVVKVIKKSFHSLKNKCIIIRELKNSRYTAKIAPDRSKIRIYIAPRMDGYSQILNEGVIAHELSHMEDWCSRSWFYFYFIRGLKISFFNYVKEEEIIADKKMIQKGYGRSLYLQRKKRFNSKNPKDVKFLRKNYWSPAEIKDYAVSIGKW